MVNLIFDLHKFVKQPLKKCKKYKELMKEILDISIPPLDTDLKKSNEESIESISNKQTFEYLTWSNPIRDFSCLATQRLLKEFSWFFNGQLDEEKVVERFKELKNLKTRSKEILHRKKKRFC